MIDLFFTLFNTVLIIGLSVYAIRNYALPQLGENIVKEHQALVEFHQEHKNLTSQQNNLEESIAEQEILAKTLFKKINQWRNVVDVTARTQQELEEHLRKEADAKISYQNQQYALKKAYEEVSPFVIEQLQHDLTLHYTKDDTGHDYIKQVLATLKTP